MNAPLLRHSSESKVGFNPKQLGVLFSRIVPDCFLKASHADFIGSAWLARQNPLERRASPHKVARRFRGFDRRLVQVASLCYDSSKQPMVS